MSDLVDSTIVIEFDNALSDHLHADRLYYSHGVFAKVDKGVAVLLAAIGVLLVSLDGSHWWNFLPFPLAVAEWFDLFSIRPLQIRLAFKSNPRFKERYRLTFGEDGIHFKTATIDSKLAWTHYNRVLESDRVFLLVYGKRLYSMIPKSSFRDASEVERFRRLAGTKIGPTRT